MAQPKISVITHIKDRLNYAIGPISSVLNQTYDNFEYIIVDYGCNQNSGDVIRNKFNDSRIRIIKTGLDSWNNSRAKNIGAINAQTSHLLFLDADKSLSPHFIETILSVYDDSVFMCGWDKKEGFTEKVLDIMSVFFVKRSHFMEVKGFNELMKGWGWEDFDLFIRLQLFLDLKIRLIPSSQIWNARTANFMQGKHQKEDVFKTHNENLHLFRHKLKGYNGNIIEFDQPLYSRSGDIIYDLEYSNISYEEK